MTLTLGSCFSGIGLMDVGLERAGMKTIWQSEIDESAASVLARQWPGVPNLGDITAVDWTTVERPDVIAGGFPCPPFSTAGKRLGRNDERYLWPILSDAIRVLRPSLVILENVGALLSADRGTIFGDIIGDLAEAGYVGKWACVRASDVGAPHRRERVFVVAYAGSAPGWEVARSAHGDEGPNEGRSQESADVAGSGGETVADTDSVARSQTVTQHRGPGAVDEPGEVERVVGLHRSSNGGDTSPDATHLGYERARGTRGRGTRLADGGDTSPDADEQGPQRREPAPRRDVPARSGAVDWGQYAPAIERWERITRPAPDPLDDKGRLNVELAGWMMGADAGWCDGLSRTAALRAYGNGVVVQVAELIGRWAVTA